MMVCRQAAELVFVDWVPLSKLIADIDRTAKDLERGEREKKTRVHFIRILKFITILAAPIHFFYHCLVASARTSLRSNGTWLADINSI